MANGIDVGSFVGSNFDGDKAIQKIMDVEKKKQIPIENYKFIYQMQKDAWNGLQKKLSDLNTASRNLYSPLYSPFRKTKSTSSNNNILEVLDDKTDPSKIESGNYPITPKQMAKADHFRSDAYPLTEKLPPMNFTVNYMGQQTPINFSGGNIQELANAINTACGSFLKATTIEIGNGLYVVDIEGKEIGKKHAITITGTIEPLKKIGLLKDASPTYDDIGITNADQLTSNKDITEILLNHKIVLEPKDFVQKAFSLPKSIEAQGELWVYLSYEDSKKNKAKSPQKSKQEAQKEKDKELNEKIKGFIDKIWVGDADLYGEGLIDSLNGIKKDSDNGSPKDNSPNNNSQNSNTKLNITLTYQNGATTIGVPFKENNTSLQIVKFPLASGVLNSIKIMNGSGFSVKIQKAELVTLNKGKLEPKNSISKAQNAIVNYKGMDYERESNTVKDVIPGATLNIKGESKSPVNINIDWDYDGIIEKIKDFIVTYNNTMDFIKNITKSKISELGVGDDYMEKIKAKRDKFEKMSDADKKDKDLDGTLYEGMLAFDSTVSFIKEKTQNITIAPYKTDAKTKVMFLSQLGIKRPSITEVNTASEEDQENFRAGYLEFTKEGQSSFLSLLKQYYTSVRQLFYTKSNPGKLTYDKGLAIEMNANLEPMVSTSFRSPDGRSSSGLIKTKKDILDSKIKRQDQQLKDLDKQLQTEEQKLRTDFGKVYSAQEQAKGLSQQLQNFGNK